MKVAVLGTGFGKEHAKLFCREKLVDEIIVWGRKPEKLKEVETELGVKTTTNLDDVLNDPDIRNIRITCLAEKNSASFKRIGVSYGVQNFGICCFSDRYGFF